MEGRAAFAACIFVVASFAQAQQPAPLFRAAVDLVQVDVRVFDGAGQFLTDLTRDDFRVREDGRMQEILTFGLIDLLTTPASGTQMPSTSRFYVIVLDDLHTHPFRAPASRSIARQFVEEQLAAHDRAAVVVTSGGRLHQDMTGDRRALLSAIDGFQGQRLAVPSIQVPPGPAAPFAPSSFVIEREERATNARTLLRTLRAVSEWLPGLDGRRKAIVLISEGIDYDLAQFDDRYASAILQDSQDTAVAAVRNNVGIYAIDPRGLPTGRRGTIRPAGVPDEDYFSTATVRAHQGLSVLADETDGFALLKSNDLAPVFNRIVGDSSRYYLLGYRASSTTSGARYRRIEVEVQKPGVRVRGRPGYYVSSASAGKPQP